MTQILDDAIAILHNLRKKEIKKKKIYNSFFIITILLLILDLCIWFGIYKLYHLSISGIAIMGIFSLLALAGISLKIAVDSTDEIKNIDSFYLEFEIKNVKGKNKKLAK